MTATGARRWLRDRRLLGGLTDRSSRRGVHGYFDRHLGRWHERRRCFDLGRRRWRLVVGLRRFFDHAGFDGAEHRFDYAVRHAGREGPEERCVQRYDGKENYSASG